MSVSFLVVFLVFDESLSACATSELSLELRILLFMISAHGKIQCMGGKLITMQRSKHPRTTSKQMGSCS